MPRIRKERKLDKPDLVISIKDGEVTTRSKARIMSTDVIEIAHAALSILEKVYGKNTTYQIASALIYEGGVDFKEIKERNHKNA